MSTGLALYRAGATLGARLPGPLGSWLGSQAGRLVGQLPDYDGRRALVASHLRRALGRPLRADEGRRLVSEVFSYYGRYWAESLRLPTVPASELSSGLVVVGEEHLWSALAAGRGVIVAAPHLGGWEWGAMYLISLGLPVTVAAEPLRPPEVFSWFVSFRERLGMHVVPVGTGASAALLRALGQRHVVCLLSDRLVAGVAGTDASFFGASTAMPAGPVALALRSKSPLMAAAIYFGPGANDHKLVFRAPLTLAPEGRFRQVVASGTQDLASELELLVRQAPTQWHLVQPHWPGDPQLRARAWRAAATRGRPPGARECASV